jgi:hypothetical protein
MAAIALRAAGVAGQFMNPWPAPGMRGSLGPGHPHRLLVGDGPGVAAVDEEERRVVGAGPDDGGGSQEALHHCLLRGHPQQDLSPFGPYLKKCGFSRIRGGDKLRS